MVRKLGLSSRIGMGGAAAMLARSEIGPTNDEIRAALDRVIASEALQNSPHLIAFLRFVVDATLRGESHQIKGYTIAVQALGRGEDFDANIDPIVRVEAGRLRRALERYYVSIGTTDPILIHIPLGRYAPEFRYRQNAIATTRGLFTRLLHLLRSWLVGI